MWNFAQYVENPYWKYLCLKEIIDVSWINELEIMQSGEIWLLGQMKISTILKWWCRRSFSQDEVPRVKTCCCCQALHPLIRKEQQLLELFTHWIDRNGGVCTSPGDETRAIQRAFSRWIWQIFISQNHRITRVGKDFERPSRPTSLQRSRTSSTRSVCSESNPTWPSMFSEMRQLPPPWASRASASPHSW